jgi:hypothetical protein
MIYKIICLFFYYLGDTCCRLNFYYLYNFFMSISVDISDKHKLEVWKCVDKPENDA